MDEAVLNRILEISERFFGTADDPAQIPVSRESLDKLLRLHSDTVKYRVEDGEPVSWVVVVPTTNALADRFLRDNITECELLDLTEPREVYEALYLCSAFTVPEHRRHGYVMELFKQAIAGIPHADGARMIAWPYSEEGRAVIDAANAMPGITIEVKK